MVRIARPKVARFHGRMEPMGRISANATMNGVKAALKNGAPTDKARPISTSPTSGQIVPMNTTKAATVSSRLLATSAPSRLTMAKTPLASSVPARRANSIKAPPMKTPSRSRMNTPRSGSLAKAWTEVMTPDRTIKVPISEKPKARIDSSMVQALSASRFSTTMAECKSAVANSQGMNEAFSTGSQNQNPPQPSS